MDIEKIRSFFPILAAKVEGKPFTYFDTAATAQKPQCVIDAISNFYATEYATVHRAIYPHAEKASSMYENVRDEAQRFIGAEHREEIIFTKGTTESLNLVAATFGEQQVKEGDEVLITQLEHHSNIVPWQEICKKKNAKLVIVPVNSDGVISVEAFTAKLTSRTKIVSICHVANSIGTVNPIKEMIELAHRKGAYVVIDGAQAASHIPLDMKSLNADFYCFSAHKLYGPTGLGVLYGKKEHLESMPIYQSGGDMVDKVTFAETTFQKSPLKFEAGTPLIAQVIGFGAALKFIQEMGLSNIAAHESALYTYALKKMKAIRAIEIHGESKDSGPIIAFTLEGMHPLDVGTLLGLKGIAIRTGHLCAQPTLACFGKESFCRVSFGMYNTFDEIDTFIKSLEEILQILLTRSRI